MAYERVETAEVRMTYDHQTGAYKAHDILITFALQNLEDPILAELPSNQEELDDFLENDYVYDMDEDGNPGIPLFQPVRLRPICSIFSDHTSNRRHQSKRE